MFFNKIKMAKTGIQPNFNTKGNKTRVLKEINIGY